MDKAEVTGAAIVEAWRQRHRRKGIFVNDGNLHPNAWKDLEKGIDEALLEVLVVEANGAALEPGLTKRRAV